MKKWKNIVRNIMLVCLVLFLTGCRKTGNTSGKLQIVTSIYPMYDFTKQIAGEYAEVVNLVPAGTEPHDYELSTGDMQLLEQADFFIYNGAGMEPFADKTIQAVSNKKLISVEASAGVSLLETEGKKDPHTWLSVKNAVLECEAIKDALIQNDSEHAEEYEANYEAYKKQLEELDGLYAEQLSACNGKTIVVAHQAFGYLCQEYGLTQEAVEGLTADSEPDAARMKELIDLCRKKGIHVIFFEELVSPKVAQSIADEVGAKTEVLNPIEGLTAEQEDESYISLMKENLRVLKEALQ